MITQDLGIATAYGYAKSKGYTGTEAEFAELMASYAEVGQTAVDAAETATTKANEASTSATNARTAANTATTKAGEASQSASTAQTASQTATTKASEASTSAQTATTKASEATTKASEASQSASDALAAKTAAETAQGNAESAKTDAESAKTDAEQAKADAQAIVDGIQAESDQIEQNKSDITELQEDKVNKADFYSAFPTDSASGSVASFHDGADSIPMESVNVNIEPIQDLHGYDSPWPAGGGKNLVALNVSPVRAQILSAVTVSEQTEQKLTMESSSKAYACLRLFYHLKAGTYTVSVSATASDSYEPAISIYKNDSPYDLIVQNIKSGTPQSFTISEDLDIDIRLFATQATAAVRTVTFRNFQIESGSTATAYAPYSNICPISGWDAVNVQRTGKNLLNYDLYKNITGIRCTVEPRDNGLAITATGDDAFTYYTSPFFPELAQVKVKEGMKVVLSWECDTDTGGYVYILPNGQGDKAKAGNNSRTKYVLYTVPAGVTFISFRFGVENSGDTIVYKNIKIEVGDAPTAYEPYQPVQSINIQLGQTVYGGKLDVTNGVLTIDHGYYTNNGTGVWNRNSDGSMFIWEAEASKAAVASDGYCNYCQYQVTFDGLKAYARSINSTIALGKGWGDIYATADDLKTAFASNPLQLVYPLVTPLTIQLDPNEVTALLGSNNVWADTGDTAVEYRADTKLYVQKKIAEAISALS